MGYRVSWIARRGASTNELLAVSKRSTTGERHEFPDVGWYLLELPSTVDSPWALIIADGSENYSSLNSSQAQSLSNGENEMLYFWCSDTVMATELMSFQGGSLIWAIRYDCEDEKKRPELEGKIPAIAYEILDSLRAEQQADAEGGADYIYDLTAELGRRLIGFRHDMDLKTDDPEPFQVLGGPTKPAWWQIWKQ
jgi:hypothetical protein